MTLRRAGTAAPTSWRTLLAVLALIVATVVGGVAALQRQVRDRSLDSAAQSAAVLTALVIDRNLTLNDITASLHPANRAQLDTDVVLLSQHGRLTGLTIWALSDGQLVYVDPYHAYGEAPNRPPDAAFTDTGRTTATPVTDPDSGADLLEVTHPYDVNGDDDPDALAVIRVPSGDVDASIGRSLWMLYAGGLFVLLVALGAVWQVRRRQLDQDHAAMHDVLTGLGNRELLRRAAGTALPAATAEDPAALLLLDLNGFKSVNDGFGHSAGDQLLCTVAERMDLICPAPASVIRLGGDEFAVLLPATGLDGALAVARRLAAAVCEPVPIDGGRVRVGVSAGAAVAPHHATELSALLHCADIAMYQAKRTDSGVLAYQPETSEPASDTKVVAP
ncbi:GGDEF domain-containing protein [Mangrovihabitans endophyticus]|uniref:GGDEF domain-containing protein n=1 Tax=Mangrovihabitans endophyticus TaxID=1751298 RepID=UPI00166A681A|nr:GGDEF domain-containing protein [Mangrovihabitans endophyticus]